MRYTNPLREYSHLLSNRLVAHLILMNKETKAKQLSKMYQAAQKMIKDFYTYRNDATFIEESGKKKEAKREISKYEMAFRMKEGKNEEIG